MSPARADKPSWLRQNYEKLLIIIVLVGLLASALMLVLRISFGRIALVEAKWERPNIEPKEAVAVDLSMLQPDLEPLTNPFQSQAYTNDLMVSELRVLSVNPEHIPVPIPYDATVCWYTQHPQPPLPDPAKRDLDADGMPDLFEDAHGLNRDDPADAQFDKDSDGFKNLEEYQFGSSPSDANDFPDVTAKLRVIGTRRIPFVLLFQGVQELKEMRFQLNLRSLERSYFVKLGEEVEGYKVLRFDPSGADGKSPTLMLQKGSEITALVKGQKVNKNEWVGALVFLLDGQRFRIKVNDEIQLKGRAYKIVDIGRNAVSIRDVETGKRYQVGPWSEGEKLELMERLGGDTSSTRSAARPTAVSLPEAPPGANQEALPSMP